MGVGVGGTPGATFQRPVWRSTCPNTRDSIEWEQPRAPDACSHVRTRRAESMVNVFAARSVLRRC